MSQGQRLRVALIASSRHPIRDPFAGGLEAHTWALADGLHRRGHDVTLFAESGSDPRLAARRLIPRRVDISPAARADVSMPTLPWMEDHHAYLGVMLDLMRDGAQQYDIVHNNSLHHLPVAMASAVTVPQVTTLHTPPTPWLESAIATGPCPITFTAVSASTAAAWQHTVTSPIRVIANGVDLDAWRPGPGGGPLVWSGRLVPEKGPDLAIAAARRAGVPLQLVGPRSDLQYFERTLRPLLGHGVEYLGHLSRHDLAGVVGAASACLVTPRWEEPYGLVAAEALACGTPVLGFARGGLPEVVGVGCSTLVPADDVPALAAAITARHALSRTAARRHAERHCGVTRMIDTYLELYRSLIEPAAA